jgi:hypothetical protein
MREVQEEWRKLHKEKLHGLYFSPNELVFWVTKNSKIGGEFDTYWRKETGLCGIGGKPKGRLRRRGKDDGGDDDYDDDDDDDNNNNNKYLVKYTIFYCNKTKTSDRRKKE